MDVVDAATMEALDKPIGTPLTGGLTGSETSSARTTGDAILSELLRNTRSRPVTAPHGRNGGDSPDFSRP